MNTYRSLRAYKLDKNKKIIILGMLFTFLLGIQLTQNAVNTGKIQERINEPKISEFDDSKIVVPYDFEIGNDFHLEYSSWNLWYQMFEGLYKNNLTDPKNEIISALAKNASWSPENLNFTVNLKENIRFHSGTELNATHVKWNFDRIAYLMNLTEEERTDEQGITSLDYLFRNNDGTPIINQTEVLEEFKIRFILNRPYAAFKSFLTCGGCLIMEPHEDLWDGSFDNPSLYKGTGPFQMDLEKSDLETGSIVLSAFENYRQGRAKLDTVVFQPVEDMDEANQKLLSGQVNYVPEVVESYREDLIDNPYISVSDPINKSTIYYIRLNNKNVEKPWRQAISYSLNYSKILNEILIDLNPTRCRSPIPKNFIYSNWSLDVPEYDIVKARQVLQDNGIATNFDINEDSEWIVAAESEEPLQTFRYLYPSYKERQTDLFYSVKHCLKYIGIKLEEIPADNWETFAPLWFDPNQCDLVFEGWGADFNDPSNMVNNLFHSQSSSNWAQINDPYLDSLLEAGLNNTDPEERKMIYDEIQGLLIEDIMPVVWLYNARKNIAYHHDFTGFQPNSLNKLWLYPVEKIVPDPIPAGGIFIDGANPNFNWTVATAEFGITGQGTINDPYVIKDRDIMSIGRYSCIYIKNSDKYFTIKNSSCSNAIGGDSTTAGIRLKNVSNGKIIDNDLSYNLFGINLISCQEINISQNLLSNNINYGIYLQQSNESIIEDNRAINNELNGINLEDSHNNSIPGNYITDLVGNTDGGVVMTTSYDNTLTNNELIGCGVYFNYPDYGTKEGLITNAIDTSNTVNGKPLYFYNSTNGLDSNDFTNPGQVILVNCNDSAISGLDISKSSTGFIAYYCDNVNLSYSVFSEGILGMGLINCSNCKIKNNLAKDNLYQGIFIGKSRDCEIYLNNFTNNGYSVMESEGCSGLSWNSSSIGNYYSDYSGKDWDDNGIGDSPYEIYRIDLTTGNMEVANYDYYPIWDDGIDLFKNPHVFRVGISRGPENAEDLDPLAVTLASMQYIEQVAEPLLAYNLSHPNLEVIPRLTNTLGTWTPDYLNYTLQLKTGVTFHDGTEFNASSIQWNYNRLAYFMNVSGDLIEEFLSYPTWANDLYRFGDGSPIINRTEILGKYEIKFVLNRPFAPFEKLLTFCSMLSPSSTDFYHYIDKDAPNPLIGTGPFTYDGYMSESRIQLSTFKNYHQGPAQIDRLVFDIIPDASVRTNLMDEGVIDYVFDPLSDFTSNPEVKYEGPINGSAIYYLIINNVNLNNAFGEINGSKWRKAMSYAVNYTEVREITNLGPVSGALPPCVPYSNFSLNFPYLNYTEARQIIQEMGYGLDLDISNDTAWIERAESVEPLTYLQYYWVSGNSAQEQTFLSIKESFKYIGVDVIGHERDWGSFLNAMWNDEHDMAFLGWGQDYNDPHSYFSPLLRSWSGNNLAKLSNGTIDNLLDQGISTADNTEREQIYNEIQRLVIEEIVPYIYIGITQHSVAYRSDINNFPINALGRVWFYDLNSDLDKVILIDGDDIGPNAQNWTWAETQEWFGGGSGKWNDPYIIENATINGYGKYCIMVRDTNAHFVIRNCTLYRSSDYFDEESLGVISLINAANGTILDCNCSQSEVSGIFLKNCSNITIEGLILNDHDDFVVRIESSNNLTIKNCHISNSSEGIKIHGSNDITVFNNTIEELLNHGIHLEGSWDNSITENLISDSSDSAILLEIQSNSNDLFSNNINASKYGIRIESCTYNDLSNNNISYSQIRAIQLNDADNCTIQENLLEYNAYGIVIYSSKDNEIVNNEIYDSSYGILADKCVGNLIKDNLLSDFSQRGVLLLDSSDILIDYNVISNGIVGIELRSTNDSQIANSTIKTLDIGIILKDSTANNINKNDINNCSDYGTYLYTYYGECNANDIYNNTFRDNYINAYDNVLSIDGANNWNSTEIGNYWDDYQGKDANDDHIGDNPYSIEGAANQIDSLPIWDDGIDIYDPILINDTDLGKNWEYFNSTYDWCSGAGTFEDPLVIANITIDASQADSGITIVNSTDYYFVIQNCKVINSSSGIYSAGIELGQDVTMGLILENNCSNNLGHGIINNGYNWIINNTINKNGQNGIYSNATAHIKGNIITENTGHGLELIGMYNITQNIIALNDKNGIVLESITPFNNITHNQIRNNTKNGISLLPGTNATKIQENSISRNLASAIFLEGSDTKNITDTNIFENRIYKNKIGVEFNEFTVNNTVWLNAFINSTKNNAIDNSLLNNWDNYTVDASYFVGNFWNNHSGPDTDHDGIVDQPFGYQVNRTNGINDTYPILYRSMEVTGSNIEIRDPVTDISMSFNDAKGGGNVNITVNNDPEAGNFEFAGASYNISTTVDMTDNFVIIKIPYDEDSIQYNEEELKLYHYNEDIGDWEDITIEVDTENNIIYGNATSFSPFAAGEDPDLDSPETTISKIKGTKNAGTEWYSDYPIIKFESYDSKSGINKTAISFDKNTWHEQDTSSLVNTFVTEFDLSTYSGLTDEGNITVYYNSTDNIGNIETTQNINISVDKVNPTASFDLTGINPSGDGVIFTSSVTIQISTEDDGSGVDTDSIEYIIDDEQPISYSEPFTISSSGSHTIQVNLLDIASNSFTDTISFTIDDSPPTTSFKVSEGQLGDNGWYSSSVKVQINAFDDFGISKKQFSWDGTSWNTYSTPIEINDEGTTTLYFRAIDNSGNTGTTNSTTFNIDTTSPTFEIQTSRTPVDGWYLGSLNVTMSAEDTTSGINSEIEYKIDDGQWFTYSEPIEITQDGLYTIYYRATDAAGNLGEAQKEIKIDSSSPTSTIAVEATAGSNGWYKSYANVTLTADDDGGSGLKNIKYSFDGTNYNTYNGIPLELEIQGTTTIYVKSEDKVGNTESPISKAISIDFQLNSTQIILRGTASTEGWYNDKVNITLNATDDISGVAYTEYSFDNEYWLTYNQSFFYDVEGNNTIYYRYHDNAGNTEPTRSKNIFIDKSSPDTDVSLGGQKSDKGWFITNVVVSFTASDSLSGILKTQYKFNSSEWSNYAAPFTVSHEGNNTIEYRSVDVANNAEEIKTVTFEINKQGTGGGINPILIIGIIGAIGAGVAVAIVIIRKKLSMEPE
ncbi:MAG: hypothetical protein GF329_12220 [Candidatus Lokiarchaeota archaeon]|nr:hypothetical protein [Candidatus Lokiarchaeota archaeon]